MQQFVKLVGLAFGYVLVLATIGQAAVWQDTVIDTSVAGGISATRFDGSKIATAYARPASNQVIVALMTPGSPITRTILGSAVKAQNVELCAASPDDTDLFCVWDDGAGNLFWARKNDGWTVRPVEQEQNVSNSFALQLHKTRRRQGKQSATGNGRCIHQAVLLNDRRSSGGPRNRCPANRAAANG